MACSNSNSSSSNVCSKKYSMTITNEIAVLRAVLYLKFGFLQRVLVGAGEGRGGGRS